MTEWRTCPRWDNFQVSDDGRIRRVVGPKWAKLMQDKALPIGGRGYVTMRLSQDGRVGSETLHTLVCEAFHGPKPSKGHYAVHGDGTKTNNVASNLRWATPTENADDALRHGVRAAGERNGRARLTEAQVRSIRAEHKAYGTYRGDRRRPLHQLAAKYGVTYGCIKGIVHGYNWKAVS